MNFTNECNPGREAPGAVSAGVVKLDCIRKPQGNDAIRSVAACVRD